MRGLLPWAPVAAAAMLTAACGVSSDDPLDEARLRALLRVPPRLEVPPVPAYNPPTPEKIELGRHLFYDPRLSGNGTQSCASCHRQELGFADGLEAPSGSTGQRLRRNSPGLANAVYQSTLTWANSGLLELEDQLLVPIRGDNPVELGVSDGNVGDVLARFDADARYAALFAAAFPDSPSGATVEKIVLALASFCRTLLSGGSPYDRYLAGDRGALSERQLRGLALFNGERFECFHCHGGTNLTLSYRDLGSTPGDTQYPFFNNGLYNVDGKGSYPAGDQGLYDVTSKPNDRGRFRPPSLRNVALTAPYMHDGSIPTLRDVVRHYAAGGRLITSGPFAGDGRVSPLKSPLVRGFAATDEEIDDVVAFLESMTDEGFLTDPRFSDPLAAPSLSRRNGATR